MNVWFERKVISLFGAGWIFCLYHPES